LGGAPEPITGTPPVCKRVPQLVRIIPRGRVYVYLHTRKLAAEKAKKEKIKAEDRKYLALLATDLRM
jgi:hypothetical protein